MLIVLLLVVFPASVLAQVAGQDAILVGLEQVYVEVDVVVSYDDPSLVGEVQLRDRLRAVLELELGRAGLTVTADATSRLVLAMAAAPITLGEQVRGVAVSSILQLKEPSLVGRAISESVDSRPAVGASAGAWRSAYWDLARDRELWVMPVWSGPLGVGLYPVDRHEQELEREAVRLAQTFINSYLAANPR
jgi:hypothetical protein